MISMLGTVLGPTTVEKDPCPHGLHNHWVIKTKEVRFKLYYSIREKSLKSKAESGERKQCQDGAKLQFQVGWAREGSPRWLHVLET